jgi:hypothetical protein
LPPLPLARQTAENRKKKIKLKEMPRLTPKAAMLAIGESAMQRQ